ncbi:MAG: DUF4976 domain-containing protein, partial [Proteiniphilum sp.]|nr:DUF4976 domain-containing protein [Proteiniphilum sp.]
DYFEKHLMNVKNKRSAWASWLESAKTSVVAKELTERYVKRPAIEFYDLKNDPWEMNNLADNIEYASRISVMKSELEKWMVQQGDKGVAMDIEF